MNAYEFLIALTFWQWVGILLLAGTLSNTLASVISIIANGFKKPQ